MTARSDNVSTDWSAVDDAFFRIVGRLFSPAFLAGAGVVLASYDEEQAVVVSESLQDEVTASSSRRQDVRA
jgi:hypothetical protein